MELQQLRRRVQPLPGSDHPVVQLCDRGDSACACCWPIPLAYVIAFKAGRYKNLILGLVILPFFVTFLIRTIAWKTILADDGWVVSALDAVGLLPSEGRLLSTSWAVIGG